MKESFFCRAPATEQAGKISRMTRRITRSDILSPPVFSPLSGDGEELGEEAQLTSALGGALRAHQRSYTCCQAQGETCGNTTARHSLRANGQMEAGEATGKGSLLWAPEKCMTVAGCLSEIEERRAQNPLQVHLPLPVAEPRNG